MGVARIDHGRHDMFRLHVAFRNSTAFDGDEHSAMVVSYSRALMPGVSFLVSGIMADFDDGLVNAPSGNSNQGTGVATGIKIRF